MWVIAKVSLVSFVWLGASLQPDSSAQLAVGAELQGGGIGDDGVESIFGFQNLPLTHIALLNYLVVGARTAVKGRRATRAS